MTTPDETRPPPDGQVPAAEPAAAGTASPPPPGSTTPEEETTGTGTVVAIGCMALTLLAILIGIALILLFG